MWDTQLAYIGKTLGSIARIKRSRDENEKHAGLETALQQSSCWPPLPNACVPLPTLRQFKMNKLHGAWLLSAIASVNILQKAFQIIRSKTCLI